MAGALTISTLNNDTGVLAVQNGMTGIAKAWVNFNGTGTVAIRNSFNVSSVTDNGTGDYTVNFTTAMPNANYAVALVNSNSIGGASVAKIASADATSAPTTMSTTQLRIGNGGGGSPVDCANLCVAILSS